MQKLSHLQEVCDAEKLLLLFCYFTTTRQMSGRGCADVVPLLS